MTALRGLAILLLLQAAGEGLTHALSLPFPGPVIGLVLLLFALQWSWVREPVSATAEFLLAHLSLLFVPVGVGVITHLDLLSRYGLELLAVIASSIWLGLAVTALVLRRLLATARPSKSHDRLRATVGLSRIHAAVRPDGDACGLRSRGRTVRQY